MIVAFYALGDTYIDWLKTLPVYAVRGDYLFVHAGIRPDVPLEEQD